MCKDIETIREYLNRVENKLRDRDEDIYDALEEMHRYENILLEFLKSKIGQKIYWAHKSWRKYETHTIKDIGVDVQTNEFFGSEYIGKECVRIYIEDGGYYIADDIGKTLFFDEEVAKLHTYKD